MLLLHFMPPYLQTVVTPECGFKISICRCCCLICSQILYIAVQGQQQRNKFKLSLLDALFTQDTYVTNVTEELSAPVTVLDTNLSPYSYRYS